MARSRDRISGVLALPTPVALAGTHAAHRLSVPALLIDEVVVLDRAVTR